jgi:hypothetical protein
VCIFPIFEQGMLFTDRLKRIRFDLNDNRLYWWCCLRSRTGCICSSAILPISPTQSDLEQTFGRLSAYCWWTWLIILFSVYLSIFWTRYFSPLNSRWLGLTWTTILSVDAADCFQSTYFSISVSSTVPMHTQIYMGKCYLAINFVSIPLFPQTQ